MTTLINPFIYAGKRVVLPATITISDVAVSPSTALASIRFETNGTITNQDSTVIGTWLTGAPYGTNEGFGFEVYWATVSGTTTAGNRDMWEAIDAGYTFSRNRTTVGTNTAVGTVTVREFLNPSNADTCTVTLEAEVTL